jgi:putative transposase
LSGAVVVAVRQRTPIWRPGERIGFVSCRQRGQIAPRARIPELERAIRPTPAQKRVLDEILWRCRDLYNTALEQRIAAYQWRQVSASRVEQEAELKGIRAEFPEYEAIHSHVLQDVLARLDKMYQAFFRRVQRGEKAGFPRFKGQKALPLLYLQRIRRATR